ncbi:MAG: ATPase [Bacteroidetes bacterium RBG_13_42_15]|nr:MAG: ATPase [Bacteroidetes bacterium RBG_13_42_15]
MKARMTGLMVLFLFGTLTLSAQKTAESFKVNGNCDMCKVRIEKAAKSVEGVLSASWNMRSKMAEVEYDSTMTDLSKIQMAIADAGHDTEMHKADDEAYNKLPACCKYKRKKE